MGDALLAVPALRWLRSSGGLTLAAHGPAARFLASIGEVDRGLAFDEPSLGWLFGTSALPEPAPGVIAWLFAPLRVRPLVQAPSRPADERTHCAEHLLSSVGGHTLDQRPLDITPLRSDEILVHPGSGSPVKNWPAAEFAAVIRDLDQVRLIVGEADQAAAEAVEQALGCRLPRLDQPSLPGLAARLAGCRAYLGNDSGVSHLAGLVGARTVAMFGPTPAAVWRPLGPNVQTLDFTTAPDRVRTALLSA